MQNQEQTHPIPNPVMSCIESVSAGSTLLYCFRNGRKKHVPIAKALN